MKFKRENKGFSLVELIVVIAIFSVVGIVVGGFLLTASRSYSINATELNLQEEAQLVSNQVQEMILDTAYGISYQYVVVDDTGASLIDYMENDAVALPEGDLSQKDVYIYGKDQYYHIFWNKEEQQLFLKEYEKNAGGSYVLVAGMPNEGVMFGQYISDFTVDLSKVASDRLVSYSITFKKAERDYLVTRTVSLRNNVLMNKPIEEVYDAAGVEFQPAADKLEVSPTATVALWPGETQKYQVTLTCSRGGVPSQDATWSISSTDGTALSADTKINAGNLLSIGTDEKSKQLALRVWADGYDYTNNVEKTLRPSFDPTPLYVNVRQITGLKITSNHFEENPIVAGGAYEVKVQMEGENLPYSIVDAGDLSAIFTMGSEYAYISNVSYSNLAVVYTVQIKDTAPENAEIGLQFKPLKEGFTEIHVETPIYKVGSSSDEILRVYNNGNSLEWLRLGSAGTRVAFANDSLEESYCNADGSLKAGYSIKYTYRVLDSMGSLKQTATSIKGTNNSQVLTGYIKSVSHKSVYEAEATLSDSVFLQSGMVVVSAELLHNTAGTTVSVGGSNVITYFIPEATIAFKRAGSDAYVSNMTSYITKNANVSSVYVNFTSGFADSSYKISLNEFKVGGTDFGNINNGLSDLTKNRISVQGNADAEYRLSKGNTIEVTYGGLPNKVSIILASANVSGTNYYVPLTVDEWTNVGTSEQGSDTRTIYKYYIDDSHNMHIEYLNGQFDKAVFNSLENMQWKETAYTMNRLNKTWELAIP